MGDKINQKGSFIIGVNKGEVKITQNSVEKNSVETAAIELKEIIETVDSKIKPNSFDDRVQVSKLVFSEVENRPDLLSKLSNAIKSGGTEVIKEIVNSPIFNILLAMLEGWNEKSPEK